MFLAVMSISRSDVVTQSVRPFTRSSVPYFSFSFFGVYLEYYEVSKSVNGNQWLSMGVNGCFKGVSKLF